jgi:hypothetical protein
MEPESQDSTFEAEAGRKSSGLIAELWGYFRARKKWWLLPIIVSLLAIGLLILFASTPAGPLIYTLF